MHHRVLLVLCCMPICACVATDEKEAGAEQSFSVTTGVIPTVVVVAIETEAPSTVRVHGTWAGGEVEELADVASTNHRLLLAGFPQGESVSVVAEIDTAGEIEERTAEVVTGTLPAWVPTVGGATGGDGFTITPPIDIEEGRVVVWNGDGDAVWAWPEAGKTGSGARARLAYDGMAILTNSVAVDVASDGYILRIPLDGGPETSVAVRGAHTDFVELPDGGYATLAWDLREVDGRSILGDQIIEIDAEGNKREIWSVWDDFSPDLSVTWPNWYTADRSVEDWSHINGLAYDPVEDAIYASMTFDDGVAKIDRTSGTLDWWFGNDGGLATPGGESLLSYPHSVQPVDGGVLVFDRKNPDESDGCSEAITVSVDEAAGTAAQTRALHGDGCSHVGFLGSAQALPNGNTLVSWTTEGHVDEIAPDNEVVWTLHTSNWGGFGFVSRVDRLGPGVE